MADAQADDNVKIGFFLIEEFRLKNRVAYIRAHFTAAFIDADGGFRDGADFTCSPHNLKALVSENPGSSTGFRNQPYAGGDAQLFRVANSAISSIRVILQ